MRSGDSTTLFEEGAGAILAADAPDILLAKQTALSLTAGDARPGAGIVWPASGCYETNSRDSGCRLTGDRAAPHCKAQR